MASRSLKSLYEMTKPGIVYGNTIHVVAGVLVAASVAKVEFSFATALAAIVGTGLVIASACVANNYIDRSIDTQMERTQGRALARGVVSGRFAIAYSALLGSIGLAILIGLTNWRVVGLAVLAYVLYVFAYTYSKRVTVHSTLIGSIPGALPIMAGYVALTDRFDVVAWLLLGLIVCWQMPHFYAISLFRKKEYAAANLPVLSVRSSVRVVKMHIVTYQVLYVLAVIALGLYGGLSLIPIAILALGALYWLALGWRGFTAPDDIKWARKVFGVSLLLSLTLLAMTGLNLVLG